MPPARRRPEREDWPAKVAARFAAALEIFAANPQLARFALAVPPRAGGEVTAHYRQALDRALEELAEGPRRVPMPRRPSSSR